jgi:hypothetical protein
MYYGVLGSYRSRWRPERELATLPILNIIVPLDLPSHSVVPGVGRKALRGEAGADNGVSRE